jgi:hypothetical protein
MADWSFPPPKASGGSEEFSVDDFTRKVEAGRERVRRAGVALKLCVEANVAYCTSIYARGLDPTPSRQCMDTLRQHAVAVDLAVARLTAAQDKLTALCTILTSCF